MCKCRHFNLFISTTCSSSPLLSKVCWKKKIGSYTDFHIFQTFTFMCSSYMCKALCFYWLFPVAYKVVYINECTFATLAWVWKVLTYQDIKWLDKDNNGCLHQSQLWLHAVPHPQPFFLAHEYCQIISVF